MLLVIFLRFVVREKKREQTKKRKKEKLKENWVEGEEERSHEFGSILNLSNWYLS